MWNKNYYLQSIFVYISGEDKEEREKERYLVVRAGQQGTTLQPVDLEQNNKEQNLQNLQNLAPGSNFQESSTPQYAKVTVGILSYIVYSQVSRQLDVT